MCVTVTTVTGVDPTDAKAGPIFWYEDVNNFYVFEIAPNGKASVWRRQRGKWLAQVDWRDADGANKGDGGVNELRVTTVGSDATFYVNGTEFRKVSGTPPDKGQQIGLFAGSPDSGAGDLRLRRPAGDQSLGPPRSPMPRAGRAPTTITTAIAKTDHLAVDRLAEEERGDHHGHERLQQLQLPDPRDAAGASAAFQMA